METLRVFENGRIICECEHGRARKGVVRDYVHHPYPFISDCKHAIDFINSLEHLKEKGYTEVPH